MTGPTKKQAAEALAAEKQAADDANPFVIKKPKPQTKDVAWAASFMNGLEPPPVIRNPE